MSFNPVQITFRSRVVGGKFYKLGVEEEVTAPWYSIYVTDFSSLNRTELEIVITGYARMQRDLGGIIFQLQTLKES